MSILDDLNEGKNSAKSIEEALKRINDEASAAGFSFESMSKIIGDVARKSTEFRQELISSGKSIKDLSKDATNLAKATKEDLKDKKTANAFEKKALEARKRVAKVESQIRVLQDLKATAQGEERKNLEKTIEVMQDGVYHSKSILRNFERISKTNEKLDKETGFIDRLAKGVKSIPGLGPLLATPLEDASKAYRSMRLKEGSTKFQAMAEGAKGLADSFGPAFLLGSLFAADKRTTDLAKNLQMSKEQAIDVKLQFTSIALESGKAFVNQKNLVEATNQLVESLGVARGFTNDIIQSQNFLTKQMGLSADEAAQFNSLMILTGEDVNQAKIDIADQVKLLEKETGIQLRLNKVVAAVAKAHAGLKAAYGFENKEIAKQVILTQKLGLEVGQTAKMASQLLDFESSIAKELEAELLTGKDLNLEQARLLALQGKSTEAAAELANQVGGTVELSKMNVLQQEALAEAMGMERNELIQSVQKREVLARLGVKNIEQLKEQGRLNELNGSALGEQLLKQYEQESAAAKFEAAVVKLQETLGTLIEGPVGSLVDKFATAVSSAGMLKGLLLGIVGISFARTIASFATMIVQMFALSGAAAATTSFITLGIGAVAAVAALTMMMGALDSAADQSKSKAQQMNANDFSMGGGSFNGNIQAGGLTLDTDGRDMFVMGGTNLLNSNNNNNAANERMVSALEKSNQIQEKILAKDTSVNITSTIDNVDYYNDQFQKINQYQTSVP